MRQFSFIPKLSVKAVALSFITLVACATAQADTTVIDNLSSASGDSLTGFASGTSIGESFVTGGTALTVTDVVFPQVYQDPTTLALSNAFSATETFGLYANNPVTNLPVTTSPLMTFTLTSGGNAAGPGFAQTTATAPNSPLATLLPGTRYWLVLSGATTQYWDYTASSSYLSAMGVTLPASNTSYDASGTYALTDGAQQMYINAVPEPSSLCLLTLAGAGAFLVVRRARSAKTA